MIYENDWHILGITGDVEATTTVVGSESDCRTISKLMVSAGIWSNAWVYPPGSSSDDIPPGSKLDGVVLHQPFELYTVPTLGGTRGTEHSMNWMGWEHHVFDE